MRGVFLLRLNIFLALITILSSNIPHPKESALSGNMSMDNGTNLPEYFCHRGFSDCLYSLTHNEALLGAFIGGLATLIAGLLAIIGAWWTVSKMEKQIKLQEKIEADRITRLRQLIRSKMPSKLSLIVEWIKSLEKVQLELLNNLDENTDTIIKENVSLGEFNPFPKELEEYIGEAIMFIGNEKVEKTFIYLLKMSQLYDTRTKELSNHIKNKSFIMVSLNIYEDLANYVLLANLIMNLFPYARYETEEISKATIPLVSDVFQYRGYDHSGKTCLEVNKFLERNLKNKNNNSLSEISDLIN